jgi:hypothetical protein
LEGPGITPALLVSENTEITGSSVSEKTTLIGKCMNSEAFQGVAKGHPIVTLRAAL